MPKAKSRSRILTRHKSQRRLKGFSLWPWIKKRFRILFLSLTVVLATIIVFASLYFYRILSQGLVRASAHPGGSQNYGRVDTGHDFNIVFFKINDFNDPTSLIDRLWLLNFQVKNGKLNLLSIPVEETLPTLKGSGMVKVAALYGLSRLSNDEEMVLFSRTLSLALGLPIDGVFYADAAGFEKLTKIAGGRWDSLIAVWPLAKSLELFKGFLLLGSAYKTNLSASSFANFLSYLTFNFPGEIKYYNAGNIYSAPEKLDLLLRSNFMDREVEAERLKIIILNGAGKTGLAYGLGRLSSNLGLNVLATGNADDGQIYNNSVLIVKSRNYYTVGRLTKSLGLKDTRLFDDPGVSENPKLRRLLRGDLVLILGRDQFE